VIERLLARIGLDRAPAADVDGLFRLHRAFVGRVPYEDIAVQLGETGPLDEAALIERLLHDGRGGYCFELNTVLAALLRAVGFVVTHHEAVVGGEGPVNHMALLVQLDGERWLADAGLGEGYLDPLPFREDATTIGPFTYTLEREPGGSWWMGQHEWSSFSGFRMTEEALPLSAFDPHHRRMATDPESSFVKTLVLQQPSVDRITTLRARTISVVGPSADTKEVVEREQFPEVLHDIFGVTVRGERLERLWAQAVDQHEEFLTRS
jgi:N-hydroxyarylamine O-acetyltransferase